MNDTTMMTQVTAHLKRATSSFKLFGAGIMVRGFEMAGKFGLYILVAHLLGAFDAGLFFLSMTWMGLTATVARMGMEKAMTRHIAAELAIGDSAAARRACLVGLGWTSAGAVTMAALTFALAKPAALYLLDQPAMVTPLLLSAAAIVPQTLLTAIAGALTGFSRTISSQFLQHALWPAILLAAIALGAKDLTALLIMLIVSLALSAAVGALLLVRELSAHRAETANTQTAVAQQPHEALPLLWHTARSLGIVEIVQVSLGAMPIMVLSAFADPASVGAFSVAHRISMLAWVVILSVGNIVAPRFAAHYRRGEMEALRAVNRHARLAVLALGAPAIVIMIALPTSILSMIGSGFDVAATSLVIMALGQAVNCLLPCQDIMLAMTGHGSQLRRINMLQCLTCLVLAPLLVPQFLLTGAAVLAAVCIAQGAVSTTLAVRRIMPAAF